MITMQTISRNVQSACTKCIRRVAAMICLFSLVAVGQLSAQTETVTLTWDMNVGATATGAEDLVTSTNSTSSNISDLAMDDSKSGRGKTTSDKGAADKTVKIPIEKAVGQDWQEEPTKYVLFTFKVESGYAFTLDKVQIPMAAVGSKAEYNVQYKAVISDAFGHQLSATLTSVAIGGGVPENLIIIGNKGTSFMGDVTLKVWGWSIESILEGTSEKGGTDFRFATPITIDGTIADIPLTLTALVPELTYTYNSLREINMRAYETARHTMPLAKVNFLKEEIDANTVVNYEIESVDLKRGPNSNLLSDVNDININKTSWLVVDRKIYKGSTLTSATLMANFSRLRNAILSSGYSITPDGDKEGGCNDATHIHRGDKLLVNLKVSIGDNYQQIQIPIRITDRYHIAYVVRGPVLGGFREVCEAGKKDPNTGETYTTAKFPDLYDGVYDILKSYYEVTPVNAWAEFDTLNYKPFDLIVLSDFPTTGTGDLITPERLPADLAQRKADGSYPYFINEMFHLVGMRPIFSWKSFFTRDNTPNWKIENGGILKGLPIQPNWKYWYTTSTNEADIQADAARVANELASWTGDIENAPEDVQAMKKLLTLHVYCDHAVFRNLEIDGVKDDDGIYDIQILKSMNSSGANARVGIQGFVREDLGDKMIPITTIQIPKCEPAANTDLAKVEGVKDGTAELYSCVEYQDVTKARFMIFAVFKDAASKINQNGIDVMISAINYLLDANPAHVEDCAYVFDNGYDYFYVDAEEDRDQFVREYGEDHVFNIYDEGVLKQYRVRYSRDDYDKNFTNDSTLFKESNPDLPYPFTPHDNKWRNKANWLQYNFPTAAHNVRLRSTAHLDSATYEVIDLRINDRVAKLHIEPTGGLKASGKFEHYDGAKSYHERFSIDTDTLLYIHSDSEHTGMLAHRHGKDNLNNKINTPLYATVYLYSAAHYDYEDETKDPVTAYKWWTYFGMPVMNGTIPYIFYMAYTYKWVEKDNNWTRMGDKTVLTTWDGYALSQEKPETFRLPGQLQYVNDTTLYLSYTPWNEEEKTGGEGANIIGYSWTAPLHIDSIRFPQDNETYDAEKHDLYNVEPKIYIYNTGRDPGWYTKTKGENGEDIEQNTHTRPEHGNEGAGDAAFGNWEAGHWYAIPIGPTRLGSWPDDLKVVPTMNAFMVMAKSSDNTAYTANEKKASIRLDYNRMVYNPIVVNRDWNSNSDDGVEINNTPRKVRRAEDDQPLLMRIIVSDGQTISNVFLIQDDSFTEGYDSGWESEYTGGANGLWVYSSFGDLFTAAFPTLDGRVLGFKAAKEDEYQFSFGDWEGERLYLNDSKLRRSTIIAKSQTYSFMASKDDEPNRFFISSVPYDIQTPTGIEDLVVVDGELQVNNPTGERLTVTVYDAAGRMFSRTVTNDALTQVNIPQGATGVYLVSVEGSQTSFVRKVVR